MDLSLQFDSKLKEITNKVIIKKDELAEQRKVINDNLYTNEVNESLKVWRKNLIDIYAHSISNELDDTFIRLQKWGDGVVDLLVNLELPLDVAIDEIRFYRNSIGNMIKEEAKLYEFTIDVFYEVLSRFDSVVDQAVHWLSLSYVRDHSAKISVAEYTVHELSIPVVRVTEEIGVIPLIGNIDTKRAQHLMETALSQGSAYHLKYLIFDLSGVPIIDTVVALQIFKVISALQLMGIEAKITGIRPEIAITMVNLGIKLEEAFTYSSLHLAIKYLN